MSETDIRAYLGFSLVSTRAKLGRQSIYLFLLDDLAPSISLGVHVSIFSLLFSSCSFFRSKTHSGLALYSMAAWLLSLNFAAPMHVSSSRDCCSSAQPGVVVYVDSANLRKQYYILLSSPLSLFLTNSFPAHPLAL